MKLARLGETELEELRMEMEMETSRMKDDFKARVAKIEKYKNPVYAQFAWQYSRFEWMLALEGLASNVTEVPERVYEKWPWLKVLVRQEAVTQEASRHHILDAHWNLHRSGSSYKLYLSLPDKLLNHHEGEVLNVWQGTHRAELTIPCSNLGINADKLKQCGIDLFLNEEIGLEFNGEHCMLPTIGSCHGCMVFRNVNVEAGDVKMRLIPLRGKPERRPNINIVVLHRFERGEAQLTLLKEGEMQHSGVKHALDTRKALTHRYCSCYCSECNLTSADSRFSKDEGMCYDILLHSKGREPQILFYALWTPQFEFHPAPNPRLWLKGNRSCVVIEENRIGEAAGTVHLKVDGVDALADSCVKYVVGTPPDGMLLPEDKVFCRASVKLPPTQPISLEAGRLGSSARLNRKQLRNMAQAEVVYLPQAWRTMATQQSDEERWVAARNRVLQYQVKNCCICEQLRQAVWRWVKNGVPCPIGKPLELEEGWQSWEFQCILPSGQQAKVSIGNKIFYPRPDGIIKASEIVSQERPWAEVDIELVYKPVNGAAAQREQILFGYCISRRGDFLYRNRACKTQYKVEAHKTVLNLGVEPVLYLPRDTREHCCVHIRHESAMLRFSPEDTRLLDCANLPWDEQNCCPLGGYIESSKYPEGLYHFWLEDRRYPHQGMIAPAEGPGVDWFQKGSKKLFDRIYSNTKGLYGPIGPPPADIQGEEKLQLAEQHKKLMQNLINRFQAPNYIPSGIEPPIFQNSITIEKLQEEAKNFKRTHY